MNDVNNAFYEKVSAARKQMKTDRYVPRYHYVAPFGNMNDPNGLCLFMGNWHLFYQMKIDNRNHWGHAYSADAVHWKDLPVAISPGTDEKECWSGAVMIEGDRAIAAYYSLDRGIMLAQSDDSLLETWEKLNGGKPVIPMPTEPEGKRLYYTFDPFIWKKNGKYYILSGKYRIDPPSGKREREEYLFESDDLTDWKFLHTFIEHDVLSAHGDDGACPYFLPLEDKYVLFHFSHMSGPKYVIGNYDTERNKFRACDGRSLTTSASFFGGLLAPSAFPENDSSLRLIHNISYCKRTPLLNQIMSLPRSVKFRDTCKDELSFNVINETESLREEKPTAQISGTMLEANREYVLNGVSAESSEIYMEFEAKNIPALEIRVMRSENNEEYTSISIYRQRGNTYYKTYRYPDFGYRRSHETVLMLDTLHSSLDTESVRRIPEMQTAYIAPQESLRVRIFVDKSVVEVYVNEMIACAARVYPTLDTSTGVSVIPIGEGIKMCSAVCYNLSSIYD